LNAVPVRMLRLWRLQVKKPDFQRFAEECIRLEAVVTLIEDKAISLNMGVVWLRLAEHAVAVQAILKRDGSEPF
jgi:hypothetical protein